MRNVFMLVTVPCLLLGLVAGASQAPQGTSVTAGYAARCATCHGTAMTGSGATGPSILAYVRYHTDKEIAALLQGDAHPSPRLSDGELKTVLADLRVLAGTNPAMATGGYTGQRGAGGGGRGAVGGRGGPGRGAAPPATPAGLPPGDGKALVQRMCSACHSWEVTTLARATEEGWREIVNTMVTLGAVGTEAEIEQVIGYLAQHYGPSVPDSAAGQTPAAVQTPTPAQPTRPAPAPPRAAQTAAVVPTGPTTLPLAGGGTLTGLVMAESEFDATVLANGRFHLLAKKGGVYHQKPITPKRDWLMYDGDHTGNRYSPLDQINLTNIQRLAPAWIFAMPDSPRLEVTPSVVDGIMYATGWNEIFALDATTGRQLWTYSEKRHDGILGEAGAGANRGPAVAGDRVFMVTDHAHLLAFNRFTGEKLWDAEMGSYLDGYSATAAPLPIGDLVLSGVAGGEEGARGFVDAFDAATGKRVWRFYTIPARGEPGSETWIGQALEHGCGATWLTGSYDPELDLTYWGVGNPCPDYTGDERLGDNLYTASVVALSAKTGELKWHYQFTPHDTHDWDSTQPMVLVDEPWEGRPRKLLVHGDRNGVFYVLDRTNGDVLLTSNLSTKVTWHRGFEKDGKPIVDPGSIATRDGVAVCPGSNGGANWPAASYNPVTRLFYIRVLDSCGVFSSHHDPLGVRGDRWFGRGTAADEARAALRILQGDMPTQSYIRSMVPFTGKKVWDYATPATRAGVMSTAGGLVFLGAEGGLVALDAKTGEPVWNLNLGQNTSASPMSYMVGGKQYIVQPGTGIIVSYALR